MNKLRAGVLLGCKTHVLAYSWLRQGHKDGVEAKLDVEGCEQDAMILTSYPLGTETFLWDPTNAPSLPENNPEH